MNNAFKLFIFFLSGLLLAERPLPKRMSKKVQSFKYKKFEDENSVLIRSKRSSKKINSFVQTNFASIVLIDSSLNGYGLVSGYTTPLSYNPNQGFVLAYRQWIPDDPEKSGYIGSAFSDDGERFIIYNRLNIDEPGEVMGRYPSAVAGPSYPYVIWNEYTSPSTGGGQYGGRPIYTWDQFYYGGGSFFSPPIDLNNGCNPLPCDPPDNWIGSLSLSYKDASPVINAIYSQWSNSTMNANDTSGSSNRWLYHSSNNISGYFSFEDAYLLFNNEDFRSGGFTSNATININDNGIGYAAVSTYFKDEITDSSHTILIRKSDDYGKTWSGDGGSGLNNTDYYFIPSKILREKFFGENLMIEGFLDTSGDSIVFDNPFVTYEVDVLAEPLGGIHLFATVIPSSSDGIYPGIDNSCGIYHFFNKDPSDPEGWEVSFIASMQVSFLFDDNWRRIYPSAAISQNNPKILFVSYMALSDTTATNFNYDVFVQRSIDGGKNWEMPINVTQTSQLGEDEVYPQLASIANDDQAYIIFQSPDYSLITVDPPNDQADFMNRIYFAKVNFKPLSTDLNHFIPQTIQLFPNYPNPFNPVTTISFSLNKSSEISITVYDILGNHITTLSKGVFPAGYHEVVWNAGDFSAGIYVYQISSDYITKTQKMILLK
ncbi:MAG: hypothetical protein CMG75_10230 [Candidatus Marinimicrobia bacterium]|nr:hypothetical protein [Candidatus Neomarinimicrobiota bacterium]|tara:strand:+ start:5407 stop:7371 length:1965 start_codon:yes stop_codon:yes gene_type:complete